MDTLPLGVYQRFSSDFVKFPNAGRYLNGLHNCNSFPSTCDVIQLVKTAINGTQLQIYSLIHYYISMAMLATKSLDVERFAPTHETMQHTILSSIAPVSFPLLLLQAVVLAG